MADNLLHRPPITRRELVEDLAKLGVRAREVLMVHCSLSSMGYVVGGADAVVTSLLELLGASGTLMVMSGWEHDPYELEQWPEALQDAYRRDPPTFHPEVSEAARENGRLPERIRTWPGARHSSHPEARFSALGASSQWLTEDQPWHHPLGAGSPLEKLLEADGSVLMLGAPLETLTLLHHAEELADVPSKKLVRYTVPTVTENGAIEWREVRDIDTSGGAFPYETVVGDRDSFQVIGEEAIAAGIGRAGQIGQSTSYLFRARELVDYAVGWIEKHFP
ncbi:MAG: aminoglycoside 3-N-acetyltransferase [Actinomycetota bacterium]|nr:aminoglycoside 3-N-acetyltransferase [Actinomycetota bacterium]